MDVCTRAVMEPVQEFGACLKQILKERNISGSELARMMAYKSRNSIFRILDEESGHSAQQAFFGRLIGEDPLALNERERAALEQALEVSRVGRQAFYSNCAMRELLMNAQQRSAMRVRIDAVGQAHDPQFRQAIRRMVRSKVAYITITGCCDRGIFEALREWICETDVTCEVRVAHLIYTGEEEIVNNISAIQPLLYCDFYRGYCVEPGVFSQEREAFYRNNCIYALMLDEQGVWYREMFVLVDKGVFMPMGRMKAERSDPFSRYFAEDIRRMPMLKAELPGSSELENYLRYTDSCRKLETHRTIYTIKPDISLCCIHPDVLLPCVKDEFWQMAGEKAQEMKDEFRRIHLARWENFFGTRKANHIIFSQEAMERFAQTGRQSDHFFAIRAYTPEERVRILSMLKEQTLRNPKVCVHFFKDSFVPPMTEIGLYEGAGVLMTKAYTNYDLAGDHAEALITQKEFCERYKEFYVGDLLERHVISREGTTALLDRLIEIARNAS